jgi:3-methylcrotonyl-CoA carboxylase alpha subunit
MIKRLLIANRGEIACRIIRTAHELGIATIAVYSDADVHAQHVQQASESYALGGNTAAESYLDSEKILSIAKEAGADAIHPGYGFLSEDGDFSRAVKAAGLIFVGPSGDNIDLMGNKERAKACAQEAGLPVAKDFSGDINNIDAFSKAAQAIGFPLLVKASAGGGGKGMRLVQTAGDLTQSIQAAAREAQASFGNAAVFLEQYIRPARHIEVQIARDSHGNAIHLYTRECSIQRRHQKVIEEAPAQIPADVQEKICQVSIDLANHIDYLGLGTLEFLLDQNNQFYFMEMNTRLQVEHPITELVTNQDCVALQLQIAAGNALPVKQADIHTKGHAIEARICAEAPLNDFMPSTGTLEVLQTPLNARFDTGVIEGDAISPFYDSMIAKLISYGNDRTEAITKLHNALTETHIVGLHTNVEFIDAILQTEAFQQEAISTEFIDQHFDALKTSIQTISDTELHACAQAYLDYRADYAKPAFSDDCFSPWLEQDSWRASGAREPDVLLQINGDPYSVKNEQPAVTEIDAYESGNNLHVFVGGKQLRVATGKCHGGVGDSTCNNSVLSSPMPGTVTQVLVQAGDTVSAGNTMVCIEAMKMEHAIKATQEATVKTVQVKVGDTTQENQPLVELEFTNT